MKRRDFVKSVAFGAAAVSSGSAFSVSEVAAKTGDTKPFRRGGNGSAKGPRFQPPASPLALGPWKYGKNSFADDAVLMFRGNPSHTFYGTGPLPAKPRLHWKYRMEDYVTTLRGKPKTWQGTGWTGTAAKLGNYVFVGSVGRNMYAFEAFTGKLAWRYRASAMYKGSICIYDNKIYGGNTDNRLWCFDASTGKKVWRHDTGRDLDSSPCVVDGRLYIAGENGYARCLDPQTGKLIWKRFLGGIGPGTKLGSNGAETSPAIADGEFYAATYDGDLFSLNTKDGSVRWKTRTNADTDASIVIWKDYIYAAAEEEAPHVYCFSRKTGKEIWRHSTNRIGYWSTPAVVDGRVYVGGDDRVMRCLDAKTGKEIWRVKTGAAIWSSPCVLENKVVFGGIDQKLYILDAKTGKELWHWKAPGRFISSPCIVGGYIWIGTATGWFYCFGP